MTESPIKDINSLSGMAISPRRFEVTPDMINRFTRAVQDDNPLWREQAPPTFVVVIGLSQLMDELPLLDYFGTLLHGKTELEFIEAIKPGDIITAATRISNIRQRQGETGKTAFITVETNYTNQRNQPVARCEQLVIGY